MQHCMVQGVQTEEVVVMQQIPLVEAYVDDVEFRVIGRDFQHLCVILIMIHDLHDA